MDALLLRAHVLHRRDVGAVSRGGGRGAGQGHQEQHRENGDNRRAGGHAGSRPWLRGSSRSFASPYIRLRSSSLRWPETLPVVCERAGSRRDRRRRPQVVRRCARLARDQLHREKGNVLGILGPNGAGKTTMVERPVDAAAGGFRPRIGRRARRHRRSALGAPGHHDDGAVRRARRESVRAREPRTVRPADGDGQEVGQAPRRGHCSRSSTSSKPAGDRCGGYSGGMRRRVDLACGLVVRPEVVFLDEPTTGLDPRSRQGVWRLISALAEQDITVLLTTQYLEEADVLSDNIIVIDHGTVIAEGTATQLKERTGGSYCEVVPLHDEQVDAAAQALGDLVPASRARRTRRRRPAVHPGARRRRDPGRGDPPARRGRRRTRRHRAAPAVARRCLPDVDRALGAHVVTDRTASATYHRRRPAPSRSNRPHCGSGSR